MRLKNNKQFAIDFINEYNTRGFGSMNKNDFEVLIFNLLKKHGSLKEKTNHEISLSLQIPENKVKRLAYESDLRYGSLTPEHIQKEFFKIISRSKLKGHLSKIEFIIENKFIRTSIDAQLKSLGHYSDSSFNSEIIRIDLESLAILLTYYYPESAIKRIIKGCELEVKENTFSTKELLHTYLKSLVSEAGKQTIGLVQLIPHLLIKS